MNNDPQEVFGWTMVTIAVVFLVGLDPRFAKKMYPNATTFPHRLAAPVIFGILSAACFAGLGRWGVFAVVLTGLPMVAMNRWKLRRRTNASRAA